MCLKIKILKRREANQCILMYFILQSSLTGLILLSYSEFSYFFSQNIRACQKHALPRNRFEKLEEVFKNNFLTAM